MPVDAAVLRIMPLGDSNTRGPEPTGQPGPLPAAIGAGGYRYPLQQMLRNAGYQFDFVGSQTSNAVGQQGSNPPASWTYDPAFDQEHQGLAGFSNGMLITGGPVPTLPGDPVLDAPSLANCLTLYRPDIVLLMSGSNGLDPANVSANLQSLDNVIRTITSRAPATRVIVSTIFDRWNTTALHDATRTYNAGIPGLVAAAQQRGELVSFVDAGGALTRDDFCFNGVMGDGVHPNPVLAMPKVANVWFDGIKAVAPVPEPNSIVLLLSAMIGLLACTRRHSKG